uniref:Brinker DNA-binding domain-containing protein n=1 Tax=Gopherus agassizii TaxID=38772 RepID=A0A452J4Z1_9SAUR
MLSYHAAFKLKVVEYMEANNNCAAAREFCINEKQKTCHETRKNKDLNNWVVECLQNGYIVTRTGIGLRALQMSKDDKYKSVKVSAFVASAGCCTYFMNHDGLCLHQQTKIAQKLPRDLELKIESFQIKSKADCEELQRDFTKLGDWAIKWQITISVVKCKVIYIGTYNPNYTYKRMESKLAVMAQERAHEVIMDL